MKAVLIALFVAAGVLVAVELGLGAAHAGDVHLADPCTAHNDKEDALQRVILDGLDGAACRLHTSREELVLSVGSNSPFHTHWSKQRITVALRAGMLRSVDEAARRGDIPSFLAGPIKRAIETVPIEKLVAGGISLRDLLSP
ncbi:MAG TPA: hypothetical protein VLB89_05375 [Gaiellaceae bacterium]|nr:hypothetical protein [Gaiellaceae bacterium]